MHNVTVYNNEVVTKLIKRIKSSYGFGEGVLKLETFVQILNLIISRKKLHHCNFLTQVQLMVNSCTAVQINARTFAIFVIFDNSFKLHSPLRLVQF